MFVQFLTMVVPGLRSLLGLAPVGLLDGLVISGSALLPLVVNEATKEPPVNGANGPRNGNRRKAPSPVQDTGGVSQKRTH